MLVWRFGCGGGVEDLGKMGWRDEVENTMKYFSSAKLSIIMSDSLNLGGKNQRKKQAGEYLVAAELCLRGFFATTFTGNMPDFDILAIDDHNNLKIIQVKTKTTDNWNLNAKKFLEIQTTPIENGLKQEVIGINNDINQSIIYVFVDFVSVGKNNPLEKIEFYLISTNDLQQIVKNNYDNHLKKHQNIRPKNSKSFHTKITKEEIVEFKDNWKIIYSQNHL